MRADRTGADTIRITVRDSSATVVADAALEAGTLRITLPPDWSPAGKAAAASLMARVAYAIRAA